MKHGLLILSGLLLAPLTALRAAESANAKPFFFYLAYMAPHTPGEFPKP